MILNFQNTNYKILGSARCFQQREVYVKYAEQVPKNYPLSN